MIFTDAFADLFNVNFDKQFYDLGDPLIISGEILDGNMPVIAMSIFDPVGKILSANNLEIITEQTFTKTISLDSPFYDKTGDYLVKFDYGQESKSHNFTILGENIELEFFPDENNIPEIILLYTEKNQYADKDMIKITGLVSTMDSPTVLIGIYDPFGISAGFYFGAIDSNLEFNTSFLVKDGVNFRIDGTYSIKAHYAESEAMSFFEYNIVPKLIDNKDIINDETNETIIENKQIVESIDDVILESENTSEQTQIDNSKIESPSIDDSPIIKTKTKLNQDVEIKKIVENKPIIKTNVVENKKINTTKKNL